MKISTVIMGSVLALSLYFLAGKICPSGACRQASAPAKSMADPTSTAIAATSLETGSLTHTAAAETLAGFTPIDSAFARAKQSNKLIMVDIYTDWCGWCKKLDRDVYSAPEVQAELQKSFVATKVNAESDVARTINNARTTERALATRWQVSAYPTVLFLKPTGEVVQTIEGYTPRAEFVGMLREIAAAARQ